MATIKTTKAKALMPNSRSSNYCWTWHTWKTFIDHKGNKIYILDGNEVTKENGNWNVLNAYQYEPQERSDKE